MAPRHILVVEDANALEAKYGPGLPIAGTYTGSLSNGGERIEMQDAAGQVIGTNTVQSMQSGVLFGYVGLVESMVKRFRKELGKDMKVIATGGLAEIIARLESADYEANLVRARARVDSVRLSRSTPAMASVQAARSAVSVRSGTCRSSRRPCALIGS